MYYSKKDIVNALKCSGIKRNDTVFFTTSIGMLGVPIVKGKITMDKVCKILLEGIKETIGNYGTILIDSKENLMFINLKNIHGEIIQRLRIKN